MLDALSVAIRYLVDELRGASAQGFHRSDVRLARAPTGAMVPVTPTTLHGEALIDGQKTMWTRELTSIEGKTIFADADELRARAARLLADLRDYADHKKPDPPLLPVIAYYGTGRLWSAHRLTGSKRKFAKDLSLQTSAYVDCLSPSSSYAQFGVWFESVVREAQNELQTGIPSPHQPQSLVAAVRHAANIVLAPSGWHTLDWDFVSSEVVASHPDHGRLPVSLLSDGIRNLIALVADLAHRAVRLNPHFAERACQLTPGIVLIDEVDMHLHPSWQQSVIASLREAFANVQFIVTTHSPIVISTVPHASIRIIDPHGISQPSLQTEGYDSTFALGTVFGVTTAPPAVPAAQQLSDYRALIEQDQADSEPARALLAKLVAHFGDQHPAILATKSLRRLQSLKARANGQVQGE